MREIHPDHIGARFFVLESLLNRIINGTIFHVKPLLHQVIKMIPRDIKIVLLESLKVSTDNVPSEPLLKGIFCTWMMMMDTGYKIALSRMFK
ncbi:MAG: hypothetical protein ACFFCS_26600 [Candidatus Hodarchaeota archaeon]